MIHHVVDHRVALRKIAARGFIFFLIRGTKADLPDRPHPGQLVSLTLTEQASLRVSFNESPTLTGTPLIDLESL